MQARTMSGRFVVLDFFRYVAAVGVVLFHVALADPARPIAGVGSYGLFVDMFFILSGFVIFHTYRDGIRSWWDYRTFVVKRVARVYPLHIIVLLAFVAVEAAGGDLPRDAATLREFVVNAALLQAWGVSSALTFNTPSWSISAELACYLAFPLVAAAVARLPIALTFALVAAAYVVGGHGHLPFWDNPHSQMVGATFDFGVLRGLVGFANGVALCKLTAAMKPRPVFLAVGVACMVVAIVMMNVFAKPDLIILLLAAATAATALGERAVRLPPRLAAACEWFGNTSYAIYMLHWGVLIAVVEPWMRHATPSGGALYAALAAVVVTLTLAGQVIYRTVESPARRWVTRTFAQPRLAAPAARSAGASR